MTEMDKKMDLQIDQRGAQMVEIENTYLDGQFDIESIKRRILQSKAIIGQGIYCMGRDLVMLKENCTHGHFIPHLEDLGITRTTAHRYMSIAVKFNTPKLQQLVGSLNGDKGAFSKLIEMSTETDENLESLLDGGTVAGLRLDDIDRMSSTELKKALRKAKKGAIEDKETNDRLIADKNDHADTLAKKLAKAQGIPQPDQWPEDVLLFNQELSNYAEDTEKFLMMVIKIIESMGSQITPDSPESMGKSWSKSAVNTANRLEGLVAELQNTVANNFAQYIADPTYVLSDPLQINPQDQDES